MNLLLKKLNFKEQKEILVLNMPTDLKPIFDDFNNYSTLLHDFNGLNKEFVMAFATKLDEVNFFAPKIDEILEGDGIFWWLYPKGSSKKYKCDFNRDNGWKIMGELAYEPVRMVAIDDDWSALRFRRVKYIKTMTRDKDFAMSELGKQKAGKK
jgi:hypothetical protein